MVIDAFDGLVAVSKVIDSYHQDVETVTRDSVDNVDVNWNVPGGKYIRFRPVINTINHDVTYSSNEVAPGIRYKLVLNFAPETEYDVTDTEMANQLLPTIVNVYANGNRIVDRKEIPTTEPTAIVIDDFSPVGMTLDLKYETRVTNAQVRSGKYNRTMRIAEARLIPQKE